MYEMPIRLWSVDVRKASSPRGRAASCTGGRLLEPGVVLVALDDPHREGHRPVLQAAELGAAADEGAGPRRRQIELVVETRDEVALLEQVRHPERVHDVL